MAPKYKDLVVYIDRNSLTFAGGPFDKVTKLNFDEKIISDLEIVDKKQFTEIIQSQIKKTQVPINLILIFSDDSSFFKELPLDSTREQQDLTEKEFLSLMPFDRTAHKLIKFIKSYQLVGINLSLRDAISEVLKPLGYRLIMSIPAIVIGGFDQKAGLTEGVVAQVLSGQDKLKTYDLLEAAHEGNEALINQITTQKKSYLPILIGVFVVLFCLLTVLLLKV